MQHERRYWFRAKRYGFGYTPSAWQGWAVLAVWAVIFITLVTAAAASAGDTTRFAISVAACAAITIALILICWRTGEPARWRWGK